MDAGLHVDTGRFAKGGHRVEREDRVWDVCHFTAVEDEQHSLPCTVIHEHSMQSPFRKRLVQWLL